MSFAMIIVLFGVRTRTSVTRGEGGSEDFNANRIAHYTSNTNPKCFVHNLLHRNLLELSPYRNVKIWRYIVLCYRE